jgi:hypothetical protein
MVRDTITVRFPSARLSLAHASLTASVCLDGEVFRKESVHRAFEADVQFIHLALCTSKDHYAEKAQLLEQRRCRDLFSGKAIKPLGDNHLETALRGKRRKKILADLPPCG